MTVSRLASAGLLLCTFSFTVWAAEPDGAALYEQHCAMCHDRGNDERIPKRAEVAARTPESVLAALTSGVMRTQATGLNEDERRSIAAYVTGKAFSTTTTVMAGQCTSPAPAFKLAAGDWDGWGVDPENSRYQPKPGLSAADVPKLKLKWAFGFPGERQAYAQPVVAGGRLFVGSASGTVYSLNASTGCVYWTYKADAGVRAAVMIAKARTGNHYIAYIGDIKATIHAVDAETGKPLWKMQLDEHPAARITGSPIFHDGRLYVPVSSIEEASATNPKYECCKFRGSLVALDGETGRQIWKTYTIADEPKPFKKSKVDTQNYGPAGAAIWSAPTVDAKRHLIYAATGDSYTDVDVNTDDAVMAFDMNTGKVVWHSQVLEKDDFIVGCPKSPNCPDSHGPDYDFGTSPILRKLPGGKQVLVAGQKSGIVWGLDPDHEGKVLWQSKVGAGSALGGVEWGHAADDQNTYAAISDKNVREGASPGIYALKLSNGEKVWGTPAPQIDCAGRQGCMPAQSAAVSVMPGVVFSGSVNGHFRAYSTKTGEILWDFDVMRDFDTVNKVPGKGGSIDGAGPAIADGIVYTNAGYAGFGGSGGNVLLAFSVDGK